MVKKKIIIFIILLSVILYITGCKEVSKASYPWEAEEAGDAPGLTTFERFTDSEFEKFGTITIEPDLKLDGEGENIDQIGIWEAPDPEGTLIFVTGKDNGVVEVWKYPFSNNEQRPLKTTKEINGLAVDQKKDKLYITIRDKLSVEVFSIPELESIIEFGEGYIGMGTISADILNKQDNETLIYVTENFHVDYFSEDGKWLGKITPNVISNVEEILIDNHHQLVYVPDQAGGEVIGAQGIYVFNPDGSFCTKEGTNRFGNGYFEENAEGITLYRIIENNEDTGRGFIIVSDQKDIDEDNDFEFFDRKTWAHIGTLRIKGVNHTDGIEATSRPLPGFPDGFFAAVDNDEEVAVVGFDTIFKAIGFE